MLRKKKGFPEENEIVLCTVQKIQYHSVFAKLDEYENNRTGMIHISEISPGRIRNIRDYVKEDKVIVCKVLRINKERGYIDLSLRRVNEGQRREKINFSKQEQIAEKIIEYVAKQHKKDPKDLYASIMSEIEDEYEGLYPFFEGIVEGNESFEGFDLDAKIVSDLDELIKQRIKPAEVTINGVYVVHCYESNGLEVIKKAFKPVEQREDAAVRYLGGGRYSISITAPEYKEAEKGLKEITDGVSKAFAKAEATASFERD